MYQINVYPVQIGWIWELRIGARVVVCGWCETKQRAESNARMG